MNFDLEILTVTADIRAIEPTHARLVWALRYTHMASRTRTYAPGVLARQLGSHCGVHSFHVFLDEVGRSWPEPIALHPPCQATLSYDEMLLVDLANAAARDDRAHFDAFVRDMVSQGGRNAIWFAARRLMRFMTTVVN